MQIKNSFDKTTLVKIAKGAGIAAVGAILTYLAETIPSVDFGDATPIVVAIAAILVNMLREYMKGK